MLKGIVSGVEKDITRIPMLVGNEYKEGWEVRDNQDRLIWGREDELQTTGTLKFKGYGLPVKVKSLLGNGVQNGTPTPDTPIMPEFCGEKTGNLWAITPNAHIGYNKDVGSDMSESAGVLQVSASNDGMSLTSHSSWDDTAWKVQVEVGKAYYISFDSMSTNIRATIYTIDGNNKVARIIANYSKNFPKNRELTILNNEQYIVISMSLNAITTAEIVKPMITTNIIPYEPYGYKIPLTCAGQTVPVYLGQVQTVRRIKKLVLTGDETYTSDPSYSRFITIFPNAKVEGLRLTQVYCTHFISVYDGRSISEVPNNSIYSSDVAVNRFFIKTTDYTSAADLKSYLAAQYTAGTPVTVWYVLAEPETGIVNEPLAKIGDYADELNNTVVTLPEIPTTTGQNTLTVDTTLAPSSLTIKGHIKEWQPENLLPVSKFEDLSDPSWWSGGYYIRYNNMPAGTYVMSTTMPEKDPGDVYFNGENALNVPYEGRPVSITINEGDSFYVLFFVDRGEYESILNGTYTVTLIKSQ